jgi:hypothetical protein
MPRIMSFALKGKITPQFTENYQLLTKGSQHDYIPPKVWTRLSLVSVQNIELSFLYSTIEMNTLIALVFGCYTGNNGPIYVRVKIYPKFLCIFLIATDCVSNNHADLIL